MGYLHGGVPLTWNDAASPAFGNGPGAAAPGDAILSVAAAGDTTMDVHGLLFNESSEDRIYCSAQILHNLWIPATGNVTFKPHVHWTFYAEPTDARTVIWKWSYVYAKGSASLATAGTFAAAPTVEAATAYTTTADAEIRKHLITPLPDVVVPVADCGPSMIFMFTLKLDGTSTVDASRVMLLSVDIHYQQGPVGTNAEYA